MKFKLKRSIPQALSYAAIAVVGLWLLASWAYQPKEHDYAWQRLASIPTLENGRLKPLDTLARNHLLTIQGKQTYKVDGQKMPPVAWLLDMIVFQKRADQYPLFRVYHPGVKQLIGMPEAKYVAFAQISPFMPVVIDQANTIFQIEPQKRTPYQRGIVQLYNQINVYLSLRASFKTYAKTSLTEEVAVYTDALKKGQHLLEDHALTPSHGSEEATALGLILEKFKAYKTLSESTTIRPIPPQEQQQVLGDWQSMGDALLKGLKPQPIHNAVGFYARLFDAYAIQDVAAFNGEVSDYAFWLEDSYPKWLGKAKLETRFNRFMPFYKSIVIYVLVFIVILMSWFFLAKDPEKETRGSRLRVTAAQLVWLGFIVHTLGLLIRMWLQGRPPITNLYTSAVFVGWFAVFLGAILERFFKNGVGAIVASIIGFLTLIIAHHLSLSGDTLEMMQAVLDSNFWLATHVITINIGYAATIVAGIVAHIYIFKRAIQRGIDPKEEKSLAKMAYGANCFAMLFMFVGTVLGGVWADQSWGRFWGWDPKENGALLIILWLAILLHARLGGFVKARGLMVMSVFSNIVTAFSWFGVNMLGIGLHSYGFMEKTFFWLMLFIFVQLFICWLALIPAKENSSQ